MVKSLKIWDVKGFNFFTLIFLIVTDIAILFNIPFLRQIFGFVLLTILPGLLILRILKLNKIDSANKFVLSVGLSISFLMLFGLLVNNVSITVGYETPLSTVPLLVLFNIAFIVLSFVGSKINKDAVFTIPAINLSTSEKAFLIIPILFPALSIFGMHIMNTTDNSIVLTFLLFSIPAYVVFVCFFKQKFPERIYPVLILLIGISLLLMASLRSNHIMGMDTHIEYYFFQTTLNNLSWVTFGHSSLDACLSISLLPTIYKSIINVPSEFLFKILYSLLFSISPLAVFIISRKYMSKFYAFLTSFFFMAQLLFLWTAEVTRTNMAILFFALAIMVLFLDNISEAKKKLFFIIFTVSCIVSHYSTAYIFFFILLFTWIGMQLLPLIVTHVTKIKILPRNATSDTRRSQINKGITITSVLLFFTVLFFWYSQVTEVAFNSGVNFIHQTFINLNQFFLLENRGMEVPQAMGKGVSSIPQKIKFIVYWLATAYIIIGVLSTTTRYKGMVSFQGLGENKPDFLKSKIDTEYFIISIVCLGILICSIILPNVLMGYNLTRLYFMMTVILSIFFVIGGIRLSETLLPISYGEIFVILIVLLLFFMCTTSTVDRLFNSPGSVLLSSEGLDHNLRYVYDQESYAAKWLQDKGDLKGRKIYTDFTGHSRLISQGEISYDRIDYEYLFLPDNIKNRWYIYLRYYNVINGKLFAINYEEHSITNLQKKFIGKFKIYNNGGSEVWI
ncbi:MAG: DUF2206 domain-containing protein [ANME-2 cluster archaeon]|nr:MAG: DUF2206 domain-containing protein [ANME-2 cluster archaeon]